MRQMESDGPGYWLGIMGPGTRQRTPRCGGRRAFLVELRRAASENHRPRARAQHGLVPCALRWRGGSGSAVSGHERTHRVLGVRPHPPPIDQPVHTGSHDVLPRRVGSAATTTRPRCAIAWPLKWILLPSARRHAASWCGADGDKDGQVYLEPAFIADAIPVLPPGGREYRLTGRTDDGEEVFSVTFDMPYVPEADGEQSGFVYAIPVTWSGDLATHLAGGWAGVGAPSTGTPIRR